MENKRSAHHTKPQHQMMGKRVDEERPITFLCNSQLQSWIKAELPDHVCGVGFLPWGLRRRSAFLLFAIIDRESLVEPEMTYPEKPGGT